MAIILTYHRPQDLVADHDGQFQMGGVLAKISEPLELGTKVDLTIVAVGEQVTIAATVLQTLGAAGVAMAFEVKSHEALVSLVEKARALGHEPGPEPQHQWNPDAGTTPAAKQASAGGLTPFQRIKTASMTEKIHMAKHGSKSERAAVIRDPNKTLHQYVIRNPHLQLDEVGQMARMTAVSADVLKTIAEKREWYQRPEIAVALVRNPRTPVPIAARVLKHVSKTELRQIAKGNGVRAAVASAARKLLLR